MPNKTTKLMPMRVQARRGSEAERIHYRNSGLPGGKGLSPEELAPGVPAAPQEDLIFHGGKTLPRMRFQNIYLGKNKSWHPSDVESIDRAITRAMQDRRLNNVMAQYFDVAALECDPIASMILDRADPARVDEPDVQALIVELFNIKAISTADLNSTIFNLILPRKAILALGDSNSQNGLGGYHGSVHVPHGGKKVTLYYSANVFSEGDNGIDSFGVPWKNVVGTLYHELNEFRTDADVNHAIETGNNAFLGWMSARGRECGDEPIAVASSLALVFQEILAGSERVPVQFMYSNAVHGPEGPIDKRH